MTAIYDAIVIGGGSAGCVLASRLSEDPTRSVLLLEAGPDFPTVGSTPREILDPDASPLSYDWGYSVLAADERRVPYMQAKVVGGGSAINGTIALRGMPADYDGWSALGNPEWSWAKVLPYFRSLERDLDFGGDLHGTEGPLPIGRPSAEDLVPLSRAFVQACQREGFPYLADHQDPVLSGVGPIPFNRESGERVSNSMAYLTNARSRINLTIRPQTHATKVLFDQDKAVGVEVYVSGVRQQVYGRQIVLAAGAIGSPAVLLRSGIGPAKDLEALGIAVRSDLPGVGGNLIDHPAVLVLLVPKGGGGADSGPSAQVLAKYTSSHSSDVNDMQLFLINRQQLAIAAPDFADEAGAAQLIAIAVAVVKPRSRGRLRLRNMDPDAAPIVDTNLLSDHEDLRRLIEGTRLAWRIANSPEIHEYTDHPVLLDQSVIDSDEMLAAAVRITSVPWLHVVGTTRMGADDDPAAVVDQFCRVRGIANLRVADASVMPDIPRANTNLATMMIAERVAEWMRQAD